jgi:hypothetical protein
MYLLIITFIITFYLLHKYVSFPKTIVKFPNINKEISDTYIDDNNVYYKYYRKRVI